MPGGNEKPVDFYSVLGLKPGCSSSELRNAYKKLAMRWHPDRRLASGNAKVAEDSKKKFQAIQEAYSVLSDDNKRFMYDAGIYEVDDDDGMSDFLGEMVVMMNDNKAQTNGSDTFEELQNLFLEMFEGDLNNFYKQPAIKSSCSSNKRNRSEFQAGGSVRIEEIGEPSLIMGSSFCVGSADSSTNSRVKR